MINKKFLSTLAPAALGVLAIILAMFLRGATLSEEGASIYVKMFGVIFGGGKAYAEAFGYEAAVEFSGGMSYFGMLAFLAVVAGVALLVFAYLKENDLFILVGNGLLLIGGLAMLLLLSAGAEIEGLPFKDFYGEYNLGLGAYVWAILCSLGGAFGIYNHKFR